MKIGEVVSPVTERLVFKSFQGAYSTEPLTLTEVSLATLIDTAGVYKMPLAVDSDFKLPLMSKSRLSSQFIFPLIVFSDRLLITEPKITYNSIIPFIISQMVYLLFDITHTCSSRNFSKHYI